MKLAMRGRLDRIFVAKRLTRRDHLELTSALLADQHITDRDRQQINQILESVQLGLVDLVD